MVSARLPHNASLSSSLKILTPAKPPPLEPDIIFIPDAIFSISILFLNL